jgi:hypothetical protein
MASIQLKIPNWLDRICVWPILLYRRLKFGQPYRRIYLGDGVYTKVDPDVYYEKCRFHWYLSGNKRKAYPVRTIKTGPRKISISFLHKEILKSRKGKLVDHRDNDPLNNLRSNLREATHSQNAMNRPKIITKTTSKYRGVSWCANCHKWRACISWMHKGRNIKKTIGFFDKNREIDAARAFDMAALKYHKDFANLNFPREDYIKTKAGYKFAGDTHLNKKSRLFRTKLSEIYLSILGRFGKLKMKGLLRKRCFS